MTQDRRTLPESATERSAEVDAFLRRVAATPSRAAGTGPGRLLFGIDATASREPTWLMAREFQAAMFQEAAGLGGLKISLAFYRGLSECKATPWLSDADDLARRMGKVECLAGPTQIGRLLEHAASQAREDRVDAVVFVGDSCEEDVDRLAVPAGRLGLLGVPVFLFQEGGQPEAARAYRHVAKLTGGACCSFDAGAARQLRALLNAVAVFAAGGRKALMDHGRREGGAVALLTQQMERR